MRILTRYVLFDLLKVFLLTLTGLTLLIFIVLIGKEAVDKGIGLGPLLLMAPYLIPQAMQFAVPGTMLLATTSVYGRMSSYNEIVAIKALGISPMVLVWPTLVVQASANKSAWTISAEEAELQLNAKEGKLIAVFHNFELEGPITYND